MMKRKTISCPNPVEIRDITDGALLRAEGGVIIAAESLKIYKAEGSLTTKAVETGNVAVVAQVGGNASARVDLRRVSVRAMEMFRLVWYSNGVKQLEAHVWCFNADGVLLHVKNPETANRLAGTQPGTLAANGNPAWTQYVREVTSDDWVAWGLAGQAI